MKWEPWNDYKLDLDLFIPEIKEPPCKTCTYFAPVRVFNRNGKMEGVTVCRIHESSQGSLDMCADFSCYRVSK